MDIGKPRQTHRLSLLNANRTMVLSTVVLHFSPSPNVFHNTNSRFTRNCSGEFCSMTRLHAATHCLSLM